MKCQIRGKAARELLKAVSKRNPVLKIIADSEKRSKYGNKKIEIDGHVFDSKREADRYAELKILERAREISDLKIQKSYDLFVNGLKISRYVADFFYIDNRTGTKVVEDAKGYLTREYVMKKKLMKAVHGIDIVEV